MTGFQPVIGLDLGGTKIDAALVAADGTILARHRVPTPAGEGSAAVLDAMASTVSAVLGQGGTATAIGVAAAGVIDPVTGMVTSATDTIRGWAGTALAAGLAARTGLPVACDNDVRAAAATELTRAEGPDASLLYLAVGTGVGGAVAVAGRVLTGAAGIAGHLGHLPSPEAAGLPCTCGATGHLEGIAAGPGIAAQYARVTGTVPGPLQRVAARAELGDAHAIAAITLGARAAGRVLGGLANAFGPHRVVVAGGVPRIGALYRNALRDAFATELMSPLRELRLTPTAPRVGHDAAVLGAATLTRTVPLHTPSTTGVSR
ncbi:ROK family protein [Streptomyces longispororuber]|uniref:ROK family protein n=1 Tax=Streptomyces longispororuber TaxID=68230 RepID=UPI00210A45EC|nr:ROK family protein [Streptomyces longispororuber]MCQ4206959.1 ROK family protein [Streptomyces longispororuber]